MKIILITLLTVIQSAAYSIVFTTTQAGGNSSKDLTVQAGKQYQLKFDLQHQTTSVVKIQIIENSVTIVDISNLTDGTHTFSFTPTSGIVTLKFVREDNDNVSRDFEVDNLVYEELIQTTQIESIHEVGRKEYELSDHLGNVRAVVSDKKVNGNTEVISATDYLPFGMSARSYSNGASTRYGYNGMEKNNEWDEGSYDFGARIFDVRLGRWLAIDPLAVKYPYSSPFLGIGNNPISLVDPDGNKIKYASKADKEALKPLIKKLMQESPSAKALIKELKKSDKTLTLSVGRLNETNVAGLVEASTQIDADANNVLFCNASLGGADAQIAFNPNSIYGSIDESGSAKRPAEVGLAQELYHASQIMNGTAETQSATFDTGEVDENGDNIDLHYLRFNNNMEEIKAADFENKVRAEIDPTGLNVPLAVDYLGTTVEGGALKLNSKDPLDYYKTKNVEKRADKLGVKVRDQNTVIPQRNIEGDIVPEKNK